MQKMNSAPSKLVKIPVKNAHFSQALPAKENRLGNIAEESDRRYVSSFATSEGSSNYNDDAAAKEEKKVEENLIGPIKSNLLPEVHTDSKQ